MSRIAGKVWGQTESILANHALEFHRIEFKAGGICSKHCHNWKWNGFFVEKGKMLVRVWQNDYDLIDTTHLIEGEWTIVKPNEFHSFKALTDVEGLELYYPEPLSEDIIRKSVGGFEV